MADIIKCRDCRYLEMWRTPEQAEKFGQVYECGLEVLTCPSPDDYCSKAKRKEEQKLGKSLEKIKAEITAIVINGQVDEHTMFIRTGEQVKQMALDIIDNYRGDKG